MPPPPPPPSPASPSSPSRVLTASGFVPYFSYTGSLAVSGSVGPMSTSGTTQTFAYSLSGVDPACASGTGSAGNSCGIHIHSATTCTANALGHYYTGTVTSDPWTSVSYTSSTSGTTSSTVSVDTGATAEQVAGRAFIVHAYDGSRIGCAILGDATQPAPAPPSPPPMTPRSYVTTASLRASGDISSYTPTLIDALRARFAAQAQAPVAYVQVDVRAGSVVLDVTISSSSRVAAESVQTALQPVLASPSAATAFLAPVAVNLTADGADTLAVEMIVTALSVSAAASQPPPATSPHTQAGRLLLALLVVAGVLVLCLAIYIFYRHAHGMPEERSVRLKEMQLTDSGKPGGALARPRDNAEKMTTAI